MFKTLWHSLFGHSYSEWKERPAMEDSIRVCSCGDYQIIGYKLSSLEELSNKYGR